MAAAADASSGWTLVDVDASSCDTLKAAKQLAPLVYHGSDGKWKVDLSAPGDGVRRCGFRCNKHLDCSFRLLIRQSGGAYCFLVKGSHTELLSPGMRANSALSWDEAEFARASVKTGAKAAEIMAAWTDEALSEAKEKGQTAAKRVEGGLEGECPKGVAEYGGACANEPYCCMYSECIAACIPHVFRVLRVFHMYSTCIHGIF